MNALQERLMRYARNRAAWQELIDAEYERLVAARDGEAVSIVEPASELRLKVIALIAVVAWSAVLIQLMAGA